MVVVSLSTSFGHDCDEVFSHSSLLKPHTMDFLRNLKLTSCSAAAEPASFGPHAVVLGLRVVVVILTVLLVRAQ